MSNVGMCPQLNCCDDMLCVRDTLVCDVSLQLCLLRWPQNRSGERELPQPTHTRTSGLIKTTGISDKLHTHRFSTLFRPCFPLDIVPAAFLCMWLLDKQLHINFKITSGSMFRLKKINRAV